MTSEQVRGAVQDAQVVGREVTITTYNGIFTGQVVFVGNNTFRLNTRDSAIFFPFWEVSDVA